MTARLVLSCSFLLLAISTSGCSPTSQSNSQSVPHNTVPQVVELPVGKHGRPLIVPVEWKGKTHQFIMDTGAQSTVFDISFRPQLGRPIGHSHIHGAAGPLESDTFATPAATVGGLSLQRIEYIYCADLQPIRQGTGKNIRGILGSDFLSHFEVRLDFDHGRLQIAEAGGLKSPLRASAIPMATDSTGRPRITALVGGTSDAVLIDTGATGNSVRQSLFEALLSSGTITGDSKQVGFAVGGAFTQLSGYVDSISAASLATDQVRVAKDDDSSVGLEWLSRFRVTLDFPNQQVLLEQGRRYREPFSRATSGLSVFCSDGHKIIAHVRSGGPGDTAGLLPGDDITAINGHPTSAMDMFDVGQRLTSRVGGTVDLTIRRGSSSFVTRIELTDRLARAPSPNTGDRSETQ